MKNEFLHELFVDCLKDLYSAERQLVAKGLPGMIKAASNPTLKKGFEDHLKQTEGHVERLEKVGELCDVALNGKKCYGMEGIITEGDEAAKMDIDEKAKDLALDAGGMKAEHYEMVGYTSAIMLATLMGHEDAAELLQQNLDEEMEANGKLEEFAQTMEEEFSSAE